MPGGTGGSAGACRPETVWADRAMDLDKSGMWWPSHSRTVPTLSPPPRCYCTSHMADAHSQIAQTQLRCSHAQASCTQPPTRHDAEAQPVRIFRPPDRPALDIKPTLKASCENLLHLRFALHNLWLGSNCRRREAIDSGRRRIRRAVRGWQLHRQARRRHSVLHTWLRLFHLTVSFFRRNTFRGRALGRHGGAQSLFGGDDSRDHRPKGACTAVPS